MSTSPPPRWTCPAISSLLVALALTGCDSDSGGDPDNGADTPEAPPPSASDGTDYTACDDGTCEVAVTDAVDIVVGEFTYAITDVSEEGLEMETDNGAGSSTGGSLSVGCVSYLAPNSAGVGCYEGTGEPLEPDPEPGELALELVDVTDGTAIIRLTMG
jgi:hypothetical protein